MTLFELGEQYEKSAALLKTQMDKLKEKIKFSKGTQASELDYRHTILSSEYYSMLQVAKELKNYYQD